MHWMEVYFLAELGCFSFLKPGLLAVDSPKSCSGFKVAEILKFVVQKSILMFNLMRIKLHIMSCSNESKIFIVTCLHFILHKNTLRAPGCSRVIGGDTASSASRGNIVLESMRRSRGDTVATLVSCSFTLDTSLGWRMSKTLCPVSSCGRKLRLLLTDSETNKILPLAESTTKRKPSELAVIRFLVSVSERRAGL